ncbi:hypothetical protein LTR17_011979 [Elasticomyces elasticus]|nr:hypothetical protein LTR17_011979 [Elasticomyces elasticus]
MPPKIKTEPGTVPASSSRSRKRPADTQTPESSVRKHAKTCYTDMITVLAGAEETPFIIHRINLCQTSEFLQSKCEEDGAEDTVRVPAVRAPIFEIYVHWLYRGEIRLSVEVPRGASERRAPERQASESQSSASTHHLSDENIDFLLLSELYVAGISLIDQNLKNSAIDEIVMRMERWGTRQVKLSSALTQYIWQSTKTASTIRKLFIDYFIGNRDTAEPFPWKPFEDTAYPHEFFFDLAERTLLYRDKKAELCRPRIARRCCYHRHDYETEEAEAEECKLQSASLRARATAQWPGARYQ